MMDSQHPQTTAPSSQYRLQICPQRYFAEFLVIFRSFVGLHTAFIYTTKLLFLPCTSLLKILMVHIKKDTWNVMRDELWMLCKCLWMNVTIHLATDHWLRHGGWHETTLWRLETASGMLSSRISGNTSNMSNTVSLESPNLSFYDATCVSYISQWIIW